MQEKKNQRDLTTEKKGKSLYILKFDIKIERRCGISKRQQRARRFRTATAHSSYTANYQIHFYAFDSCRAFEWNGAGALEI